MKARTAINGFLLLLLLAALSGCAYFGGYGSSRFVVIAEPTDGHPPYKTTLTATAYVNSAGQPYGTYMWEFPTGMLSTGTDNDIVVRVNEANLRVSCSWTDGQTTRGPYEVVLGTVNTAPMIYPPLINGRRDNWVGWGVLTRYTWPENQSLTQCDPIDPRGILDPNGDDVTIRCILVYTEEGGYNTLFTPPYHVLSDGQPEYHALDRNGSVVENSVIHYPGYGGAPTTMHRGDDMPYPLTILDKTYPWNSCHDYFDYCNPFAEVVWIYICVEDEYGARSDAIFFFPIDDDRHVNGLSVDDHPFSAEDLDCCGLGDDCDDCDDCADWDCPDCEELAPANPWDADPDDDWQWSPNPRPNDNDRGGCPSC